MDWEKIKLGSWSAIGGAAVLALIGFNYGGWVTGGTAAAMAKEVAADAVAERLGAICVVQFNRDSEKSEKLVPTPSQVAPRGYGSPGQTSRM